LEEEDQSFDIVTSTLVCHHLTDEELTLFIQKGKKVAKRMLLCNDLHRHPLAYGLFALVAPLLFPNRLIFHDGLLSIRRAFTRKDLEKLTEELPKAKISWHWPFRWIVKI
jgi:2-polyprenyl-3-methyl-5-hydroxy-6-metoxy-1,4-benzoquinol methylase